LEAREKNQRGQLRRIEEGRFWPHKWYEVSTVKGGTLKCRSSFEVGFTRLLDADSEVVEFLYEPLWVPFSWQGVRCKTRPDFLVRYRNGTVLLVEVKPEWAVRRYPKVRAKLLAMHLFAERWGLVFRWWTGTTYSELVREGALWKR